MAQWSARLVAEAAFPAYSKYGTFLKCSVRQKIKIFGLKKEPTFS